MSIFGDTGNNDLQAALAAIQAVPVPTGAALSLPQLQQYVQAGVLTPQQYQALLADPQTYSKIIQQTQDSTGTNTQKAALKQEAGIAENGGSTPINQANLLNNINTTNQAMQGARGAITEDAKTRGVDGGGLEFISKLLNEQGNAANANTGAVNAEADNARLALQALSAEQGGGATLQGQQNQSSQAQADAATQIEEYNKSLANTAAMYNTQNSNQAQQMNLANAQGISDKNTGNVNARTEYNASVPQQVFNDQMSKATGTAGAYGNIASNSLQSTRDNAAFTGNLIGTGATVLGTMYGGPAGGAVAGAAAKGAFGAGSNKYDANGNPMFSDGGEIGGKCYAQGGEAHDHRICMKVGGDVPGEAKVPGDSQQNDTVPAELSPHEIVLPRSVSQAPNAPQAAQSFVQNLKGGQPQMPQQSQGPKSFADVIRTLSEQGLELTISPKGA